VYFPLTSDKIQAALERGEILAPDGEEEEIVTKTTRPCEKSGLLTIAAGEAHTGRARFRMVLTMD
jgi:hypothetical protein